jgi:selenocysteine-specific elongation factor
MRSVVLGTAGHIDHGKTSLVRALTGVDTDRLAEEKRRGISIELGFANLDVGDVHFGIVDVPGHERFVKNMLAGAGGIDLVVLVVAADEGVMPQTREHLDIVDFLDVSRGVVALTKSDLVDEESLEIARLDVEEAIATTCLRGAPIIPVSSTTGAGLEELKHALVEAARSVPVRSDVGAFRLPVDRVFVMEGFGTVVTGTCFSGSVGVGDRLQLLPSGRDVRVRRVQVHGKDVERAIAGQRTAVALHGVTKEEVERGHQLVSPDSLASSHMIDVRLRVSPRWVRPIRNRERVRFHSGAAEDLGRVVLLEGDLLEPGKSGLAQIRLETPAVPAVGDRFVLRSYSPMHAMAGGVVIDPHPKKHGRHKAEEIDALKSREEGGALAILLEAVADAGLKGVKTQELVEKTSMTREDVERAVAEEAIAGSLRRSENGRIFSADAWNVARRTIVEEGRRYQERHALRWGPTREEIRAWLRGEASAAIVGEIVEELARAGEVQLRGERVRTGGGEIAFEGKAAAERARIERVYKEAQCAPPGTAEVVAQAGDRALASDVVNALLDLEVLVKVTPEMLVHREAMETLRAALRKIAARDGVISLAALRDETGLSRKFSVPLLEHLDARRVTRREGDVRVLLDAGR